MPANSITGNTPAPQTVAITFNQLHLLHQQITIVTDELNPLVGSYSPIKASIFIRNFSQSLTDLEPQLNTPASKPYFDNLQSVVNDIQSELNTATADRLFTLAIVAERLLFSVIACLVPAFNVEGV